MAEPDFDQQRADLLRQALNVLRSTLREACPRLRIYEPSELTLVAKVAEGNGRTTVYQYTDNKGKTVAVKQLVPLHPELSTNVTMLAREAVLMQQLAGNENMVRLLGVVYDDGGDLKGEGEGGAAAAAPASFSGAGGTSLAPAAAGGGARAGTPLPTAGLVLEWVPGGTLRKALLDNMGTVSRTKYTYADAHRWCLSIAQAIADLHALRQPGPVLHRDLNPFNVLLTSPILGQAGAKLLDFGFHARLPAPAAGEQQTPAVGGGKDDGKLLTMEVGAYLFMAPEVLRAAGSGGTGGAGGGDGVGGSATRAGRGRYSMPADVFSLGCLIYEVFSGTVRSAMLFDDKATQEQLKEYALKVADGHRPDLPASWPSGLKDLVQRCWAGEPADRPTAQEVVETLQLLKADGAVHEMDATKVTAMADIVNNLINAFCTVS